MIDKLTIDEKIRLLSGVGWWRTYEIDSVGLPALFMCDGPHGLRIQDKQGDHLGINQSEKAVCYPTESTVACSFDKNLLFELGKTLGKEALKAKSDMVLGPGVNIKRTPLCGRNFEYYSEDPLLSGMMASAMTQGVQKVPGCGTTIKHFACNNQEDNRKGSDSVISERVLREIYLRGFEIAVKTAQPMSIMTSYNMINGVHAANSYDLCTKAARMEWGFVGAIMSDWTTTTESNAGVCTASGCLMAGNDLIMPGAVSDHENIYEALSKGTLTEERLDECVTNIVHLILQSNQYTEAVSYLEQFEELSVYMEAN